MDNLNCKDQNSMEIICKAGMGKNQNDMLFITYGRIPRENKFSMDFSENHVINFH